MRSNKEPKVTLTLAFPPNFRAAIYAEAHRTGATPSKVVEDVLVRYLPKFVAERLGSDLAEQHMPEPGREETQ